VKLEPHGSHTPDIGDSDVQQKWMGRHWICTWLLNNIEYDSATGSKMKQTNMEKSEKCNNPLITDHSD